MHDPDLQCLPPASTGGDPVFWTSKFNMSVNCLCFGFLVGESSATGSIEDGKVVDIVIFAYQFGTIARTFAFPDALRYKSPSCAIEFEPVA